MPLLSNLFGHKDKGDPLTDPGIAGVNLPEDQRAQLQRDVSLLEDKSGARSQKLQAAADRTVRTAVEDSIKNFRMVELGRCPMCGKPLFQHMGATICDACGWHQYDRPKTGEVRVHLRDSTDVVAGERAYVVKSGACLVMHNGVVVAQIPANSYNWVEYVWPEEELVQRQQEAQRKLKVQCGWCGKDTDPLQDGFHLVHVAFGASQERYCFCSDDCYEAFRKMYPARVHRNCYERDCEDCNLCQKRYDDDASEMRMLAKDYIRSEKGRGR